ncbi:hypothetical protein [Leucobacter massiliensis]|uniref:DUF7882 domain-containing protein n=1 Tax=Leucobacter massiliensis TaxID=1686285 RepID=A0A2S9QP95_9MICO|nr:hypothetical protein [Leucobacter massiliensis]PRI11406.1 hypothetical protein B4915_06080 [Leucobacter massiliensis]
MGNLRYGEADFEFDDRVLAHLKAAIGVKLRRRQSFFLHWTKPPTEGSGRVSLWISPDAPLAFRFGSSMPPELNHAWVRTLIHLAGTERGMRVVSEEEAEHFAKRRRV